VAPVGREIAGAFFNDMKRESLKLSEEQWANLEKLARQTKSKVERGPTKGKPGWRALLRRLADGELTVTAIDQP